MFPALAGAAISAAKSDAVGRAAESVGQGLAGLVGDTKKDKDRKARAAGLTTAALAGDANAFRQLIYDAFEPSRGALGDDRRPDGTRSPPLSRELAIRGLKKYAAQYGGVPPQYQAYAERIGAAVNSGMEPLLEQVLTPAIDTITDAALDRAAERGKETASRYMPLIVGGAIVLVVLVYVATRKRSA